MKPVVIVGAGLAGLACARTLKRSRVPFQIIDASDRIGGVLKSDQVGGYVLDRGYQTYLTAYPHAREQLDEDKLDLRVAQRGVSVIWNGDQHVLDRDRPIHLALSGFLSMGDKMRLARWTRNVQWMDPEDIADVPNRSTEQYLRELGFSQEFIERLARPLVGMLLHDRSLSASCRQAVFLWKAWTEGESATPQNGIEAIPRQLGATFGADVLRLNSPVKELVVTDQAVQGVRLEGGEEIAADHVVLATDPATAVRIAGWDVEVETTSAATVYFSAEKPPIEDYALAVNGNMRGLAEFVAISPRKTPRALIAVGVSGDRAESDEQLAEILKSELRLWFPGQGVEDWRFLAAYRIQSSRLASESKNEIQGLQVASELRGGGTIDGAIRLGVDCAREIIGAIPVSAA